jgi:hypothetical protein
MVYRNRAGKPKMEIPFEVPVGGFDNVQFQFQTEA